MGSRIAAILLKSFLALLCGASLCVAQAADKRYSVMIVTYRGVTDAERGFMDALKTRLPVDFVMRDAAEDRSRIAGFVDEAKVMKPDLIYTFGTTVTLDMVGAHDQVDRSRHVTDIPVIFNIVADPVGARLTRELRGSGRNLTGVSHIVPMPAQLTAIQRFKPVSRLGAVFNPFEANSTLAVSDLKSAQKQFGFELVAEGLAIEKGEKPSALAISDAVRKVLEQRVDFLYLPSDSSLIQQADVIVAAATAAGVPVVSATESPIRKDGAMLGLVSNYYNAGSFAAYKAEQILKQGRYAGDVPVETLQRFSLLINMRTARYLQIFPPLRELKFAELLD
ncbi:MAG: ABC transporter substrate-binding protein [Moraxellaceae bacterium]|nr:ABC transporter substrate-binding protein [Moraxellaceae bacterium]